MTIRVLIADDHEIVRSGVKSVLAEETDMQVVGEASTGQETLELVLGLRPDVVLLDIRMPGNDDLDTLERIKLESESTQVLVLSCYDNLAYVARAVTMGASGFLLKTTQHRELCDAIRRVVGGKSIWTREELRRIQAVSADSRPSDDIEISLTRRETEVLRQVSHGLTNREIAQALGISSETVKEHVQHILRKVGVVDRTQAAVWAARKGLV